MEQIINYRDIPTDKRIDILNALERIGFFPAYGGVRTMQQIMEKSVPGSGPQFYFVFRENELIGYNFLIGDTKKYKAFPWLAISNIANMSKEGKHISMDTLARICETLNCEITDVIELVPDEPASTGGKEHERIETKNNGKRN